MKTIFWWGIVNPICTQELVNDAHGWPLTQVRVAAPQADSEHCPHIGHLKVALQARVGDLIDPQVECSKVAMLRVRFPHIVVQEPPGAAMTLPELAIIIWSIKSRGRLGDQLCKVELAKAKSSPRTNTLESVDFFVIEQSTYKCRLTRLDDQSNLLSFPGK